MTAKMTVDDVRRLGFEWPKYAIIYEYLEIEDGRFDLSRTIEKLERSWAFYRQQLNDAYNFKRQTGADYADFTDKRDEYARKERTLRQAIGYLNTILQEWGGTGQNQTL